MGAILLKHTAFGRLSHRPRATRRSRRPANGRPRAAARSVLDGRGTAGIACARRMRALISAYEGVAFVASHQREGVQVSVTSCRILVVRLGPRPARATRVNTRERRHRSAHGGSHGAHRGRTVALAYDRRSPTYGARSADDGRRSGGVPRNSTVDAATLDLRREDRVREVWQRSCTSLKRSVLDRFVASCTIKAERHVMHDRRNRNYAKGPVGIRTRVAGSLRSATRMGRGHGSASAVSATRSACGPASRPRSSTARGTNVPRGRSRRGPRSSSTVTTSKVQHRAYETLQRAVADVVGTGARRAHAPGTHRARADRGP